MKEPQQLTEAQIDAVVRCVLDDLNPRIHEYIDRAYAAGVKSVYRKKAENKHAEHTKERIKVEANWRMLTYYNIGKCKTDKDKPGTDFAKRMRKAHNLTATLGTVKNWVSLLNSGKNK